MIKVVEGTNEGEREVFRGTMEECVAEIARLKEADDGTKTVGWWTEPVGFVLGNGFKMVHEPSEFHLYEGEELIETLDDAFGILSLAVSEGAIRAKVYEVAKEWCSPDDAEVFK
jgi:hypothetical protein